jgi:hypothetical protein
VQQPDYAQFFEAYVETFNRSMSDDADTDAIRGSYAEYFVSAGAGGVVRGGANDKTYADVLKQGAGFYRAIGLQGTTLQKVAVTPIDAEHDLVRAFFRADYVRKDGAPVSIEFDLVYMLQRRAEGPKIFAFVAGDEMALYRRYGLVGEDGKPA